MKEKIVEIKYSSLTPTIYDGRRIPNLFIPEGEINPFYGIENADEFTWKLSSEPIEKVDNLSEDIYVQPFDTNEVEILGDAVTLGYQITKEEFEELLRKS